MIKDTWLFMCGTDDPGHVALYLTQMLYPTQMIKDTWLFTCSCLRCEQPKHKQVKQAHQQSAAPARPRTLAFLPINAQPFASGLPLNARQTLHACCMPPCLSSRVLASPCIPSASFAVSLRLSLSV